MLYSGTNSPRRYTSGAISSMVVMADGYIGYKMSGATTSLYVPEKFSTRENQKQKKLF
jgi:hypothetical protein